MLVSAAAIDALLEAESEQGWFPSSLTLQWLAPDERIDRATATATVASMDKEHIRFRVACPGIYRGEVKFSKFCNPQITDARGELFRIVNCPREIPLGGTGTIAIEFHANARLTVRVPYGNGLRFVASPPGEVMPGLIEIAVAADRPHEVNLGSAWTLHIEAGNGAVRQTAEIGIEVPDPKPGRVFYILTEDCETFDGGPLTGNYGAGAVFGNHNNFMDPQDYLVQMVEKPSRLNEIADKYGARWTHFWAAPQRFAVDWARLQSSTGAWDQVAEALDSSIRSGSVRHEYAPHLHCDYEPTSALPPQPRLVYDSATDGILPNDYYDPIENPTHKYHDWDGAARGGPGIKPLGTWDDVDTKTGSLFKSLHYISQQQAASRHTLVGRTGSYDFGGNADDQEISTRAYEAVGLRANSDARIASEQAIPGGHMFWCRRSDRLQRISRLEDAALVQLAVTRDFSFDVIEDVNGWFEKHWPTCQGKGVHALSLMTHAMFMRGFPDPFTSLEGGSFEVLDRHLAWVRDHYPQIEFATATEAVTEFLDYYTPTLTAMVDARLIGGEPEVGRFVFSVRLLGKGIRVDAEHPAEIRLMAPALFTPDKVREVVARNGSQELGRATGHVITILIDNRDIELTLEVRADESAGLFGAPPVFHDRPVNQWLPDLLLAKRFFLAGMSTCGYGMALLGMALRKLGRSPVSVLMEFECPVSSGVDFALSCDGTETTFTGLDGKPLAKVFIRPDEPKSLGARVRAALRMILK